MHISGMFEGEVDIQSAKVDIQNELRSFSNKISEKTINYHKDSDTIKKIAVSPSKIEKKSS